MKTNAAAKHAKEDAKRIFIHGNYAFFGVLASWRFKFPCIWAALDTFPVIINNCVQQLNRFLSRVAEGRAR